MYKSESISKANKFARENGRYLCVEFDEEGEYGWEATFGDYVFISKNDIEVLYAALNELEK